ncbi:hypothetical protein C1H46_031951 [Malus baccata]|uniref:BCNT-C domain-containing protein n=1 Tax=Malus baccata TaxID=106549 RepID=A0A540L7Q1_MALBA|nr:hypothetical protein C1H46_031951 [Malus baccata]
MNKGVSNKQFKDLLNKSSSSVNKTPKKSSNNWLGYLGLAQKKAESPKEDALRKRSSVSPNSSGDNGVQDKSNDEARRLVAAALVEVKDAAVATSGRGKVEITEVRDFAGQQIEYKKLVDADSKEASEKVKAPAHSGVDAFLEQIKKKPKLSVLDKTKKDWGSLKKRKASRFPRVPTEEGCTAGRAGQKEARYAGGSITAKDSGLRPIDIFKFSNWEFSREDGQLLQF